MDGPGTYSQPPQAGGSKDESGTAAKDTISIGSGDRVSGADRMGMEVHKEHSFVCIQRLQETKEGCMWIWNAKNLCLGIWWL